MEDSNLSGTVPGQSFGDGNNAFQLPEHLINKIEIAKRLLGEIDLELKELNFGPTGEPMQPPALPGGVIFKDEIEKIRDAISGKLTLPPGIRIEDIELTQSTQFFNFDSLSSGAGSDNSVPLIAKKDLVIRVYVAKRTGLTRYVPANITGRIRFAGKDFSPLNGPIKTLDKGMIRRSNINHTLNFRIPGSLCTGNRTIRVRVFDADTYTGTGGVGIYIDISLKSSSTTETFYASFREAPPLRVCGVMVNYVGPPNFNLPAPLGTDLPVSLARFLPMFPIHGFDFGPCTVTSWGDDMAIKSGEKGSGWDSLLTFISNLRSASTIRAFYIGLLPANLSGQISSWQRGIGNPGIAIAAQNDTRALSHELGHAMYLQHLDDGIAAGPFEANYPKYKDGTFPFGTIGEFGLNTSRMTLFNPAASFDLMTYFDAADVPFPSNTWISPYHYQRMMNALKLSDGTGDIVIITGIIVMANFRVHRNGKVEIKPSYIVDQVNMHDSSPRVDSIMLDIHGANGEILRSHHCHRHNPYQEADGPFVDYHEIIPWSEEFTAISVIRNNEVIHTIQMAGHGSQIRLEDIRRVHREGDRMYLQWNIESENAERPVMIRYSHDNGKTWQAIAAGITENSHLVNLDSLPGGRECRLEIIASGFQKASVQSEAFEVPVKPRKVYLYSPRDGEHFREGFAITFSGGGYSPDHHTCAFDDISWHSNIQGWLGCGNQLIRNDLVPGTHYITMSMPDASGGEAKAGVWIRITDSDLPEVITDPCHPKAI